MMMLMGPCQVVTTISTARIDLVASLNIMVITQMEALQVCTITLTGELYPILCLHGKLFFQ